MSTEKMREEFEVWAMKKHSHYLSPFKRVDGCDPRIDGADRYLHGEVQQDWAAWKASRAAIEVELPAENPLGRGPGDCEGGLPSFEQHCAAECNLILRDCRDAIEYLGLKVKP